MTAFSRYTLVRSAYEDTPVGVRNERDNLLTFGVSIGLPVFNRNQGAKAESAAAISQARTRREFLESVVRPKWRVPTHVMRRRVQRSRLLSKV